MAENTHGICSTTRCTGMNVDAFVCTGVAESNLDNGVAVVLGDINKDSSGNIQGYEFTVTAATSASYNIWIVRTPEVGTTIGTNLLNDPRYFYNEQGKPMTLFYMNPHVDCIEVDGNCFVSGSAPTDQPTYTFVTIGAGGKFAVAESAPASGAYFSIVGTHFFDVGGEIVPSYVLRCEKNFEEGATA